MRFKNCELLLRSVTAQCTLIACFLVRIISMTFGNITTVIAAACLTYLPADQKWNRLIAYWFTGLQVSQALYAYTLS